MIVEEWREEIISSHGLFFPFLEADGFSLLFTASKKEKDTGGKDIFSRNFLLFPAFQS